MYFEFLSLNSFTCIIFKKYFYKENLTGGNPSLNDVMINVLRNTGILFHVFFFVSLQHAKANSFNRFPSFASVAQTKYFLSLSLLVDNYPRVGLNIACMAVVTLLYYVTLI